MGQVGTIRVDTQNNGTVDVPVFETGDSSSDVYEFVRVETQGGTGFIPVTDTGDAAYPYLRVQSQNNGIVAITDTKGSTIPDSAVHNVKAADYDDNNNKWVSTIGPNIPALGGSPTKITESINGINKTVVRYGGSNDVSQTKSDPYPLSDTKQAFIYAAKIQQTSFDTDYLIDGSAVNQFTHIVESGGNYRILSGSTDVSGGSVDNNAHVFALEKEGSSFALYQDDPTTPLLSGPSGTSDLGAITIGGDSGGDKEMEVDVIEMTTLSGHTSDEFESEFNRVKSEYGI